MIERAGPTRATVVITYSDRTLELEITDAGRVPGRARVGSAPGGNDLAGMRERVMLHGGELRTRAGRRGGFRLNARIPIDPLAGPRAAPAAEPSPVQHKQHGRWFDPALAAILLAVSQTELMRVSRHRCGHGESAIVVLSRSFVPGTGFASRPRVRRAAEVDVLTRRSPPGATFIARKRSWAGQSTGGPTGPSAASRAAASLVCFGETRNVR
jgi:hypothetical protein